MDIIKAIQQLLQNYGQKNPQQAQAIANAGQPILNTVQQGARNLANVNVPGASQAAALPSFIQSAFPVTQVPGAVQEALRSQGRIASNTANPLDYMGSALTLAGIAVPEIVGAMRGVAPEAQAARATPITSPGVPKTPEAIPSDITMTPEAQTPYAGWPPHIRAAKLAEQAATEGASGGPTALQKLGQTLGNIARPIGNFVGSIQKNPVIQGAELVAGVRWGPELASNVAGAALAEGRQLLGMNNDITASGTPLTPEQQKAADADMQKQINVDMPNPVDNHTMNSVTANQSLLKQWNSLTGTSAYTNSLAFDPAQDYARKVDTGLGIVKDQINAQEAMRQKWVTDSTMDAQYRNVLKALNNTSLLNANDWYQKLQTNNLPAFNKLQGLLTVLRKDGVDVDKNIIGVDGKSAASFLSGLQQNLITDYKQAYDAYGTIPMTPPEMPPAPTQAPGIPAGKMFQPLTGGGGGLPKAGPHGLPPLQPNGMPMKKTVIPPKYMYR